MAMTLMIDNINIHHAPYKSDALPSGNYYKFYQTKLRQLVTQTRYRKEQEARISRQKQTPDNNRITEQRLHKEYMNHIRERSKIQSQEILTNKLDDIRKSSDSIRSNTNHTPTLSISSTSIESRPKSIIKPKSTLL